MLYFFHRSSLKCSGSKSLCDYLLDTNHTLMKTSLKNPTKWNISKQAEHMIKNMIIVHMEFPSSKVDMTILESIFTWSDQIATFGGIFGIWAELTGFSFLGIINILLIIMKLLLSLIKYWILRKVENLKLHCLANSKDNQAND